MAYFEYHYTVTMGDTNAMGNVYFVNYFGLQGHIRELWMKAHVADYEQYLSQGLILSTKSAHCDFKIPFFMFDDMIVRLSFSDLERVSVRLNFQYYLSGKPECCATGWQSVVFKDKNRKTCRMPEAFREAFSNFLEDMP